MAGRTLTISHKGMEITVKEGYDDRCALVVDNHRMDTEKKFKPACREALTYILEEAGKMKGDYER